MIPAVIRVDEFIDRRSLYFPDNLSVIVKKNDALHIAIHGDPLSWCRGITHAVTNFSPLHISTGEMNLCISSLDGRGNYSSFWSVTAARVE